MTNLNVKVPEISFESASIENINMASKWTSKGAATAVTSCLLEKNDSEMQMNTLKVQMTKGLIDDFTENSDIPLKFVN